MIYDIVLNLEKSGIKPRVKVSQYDKTLPQIRASLFCNNQAFNIPSGSTVFIMGTKKDNTGFEYECTYENNVVTATITDQMTVFAGDVECEFTINTSDSRKGTENFILEVEPCALSDDVEISESDIPIIQHITDYISEASEYAELSHSWANYGDNSAEPTADNNSKHWSDVSHNWANYGDDSTSPSATNNAKHWSDVAESNSEVAHNWANYGDSATSPSATNNAKYWSDVAQQYAQGGLTYRGSILFANIPTTGMVAGDMYNMEDDFTTDSRFQEGAGISVKAGTNIAWNGTKWDLLAVGGGGAEDYTELANKPQINGVTLSGNKTASDLGLAIGENLLANAHFNVNTTGFTSKTYSGWEYGKTIDSYTAYFGSDGGSASYSNKEITLTKFNGEGSRAWLYQFLDNSDNIKGKQVCLSARINGTVYSGSAIVPLADEHEGVPLIDNEDLKVALVISIGSTYYTDGQPSFTDAFIVELVRKQAVDTSVTIQDLKLELGDHSTLLQELEPNENLEVIKCNGVMRSNRNLVDNAWFTVNQRGFTSATVQQTGESVPFIDRWTGLWYASGASASTYTVTSNGLTLNTVAKGNNDFVRQGLKQNFPSLSQLKGKFLTFSILLSTGEILSTTKLMGTDNTYYNFPRITISEDFSFVTRINFDTNQFYVGFDNYTDTAKELTIKAVKLELGSESTIDLDIAPDYTTELLKCQRYYHKYRTQSLRPNYKEDCVPEMRINPTHETITIDGVTYYVNNAEL